MIAEKVKDGGLQAQESADGLMGMAERLNELVNNSKKA